MTRSLGLIAAALSCGLLCFNSIAAPGGGGGNGGGGSSGGGSANGGQKPEPVVTLVASSQSATLGQSVTLSAVSSITNVRLKIQLSDGAGGWIGLNNSGQLFTGTPITVTVATGGSSGLGEGCYEARAHADSSTVTSQAVSPTIGFCVTPANHPPVADAGGPYAGHTLDVLVDVDPDTINLGANGRWLTTYLRVNGSGTGPVQLDGSGSYDEDGDPLTYSWVVVNSANAIVATASGVNPTLELPAGSYLVALEVSDGKASDEDFTTADMALLNLFSLAPETLKLNGVPADKGQMQDAVTLMLKFDRAAVSATLSEGLATMWISGSARGQDVVRVIARGKAARK